MARSLVLAVRSSWRRRLWRLGCRPNWSVLDATVKQVETRLADGATNEPMLGSGSAIEFENGGYQVSVQEPAVDRSRPGDPVRCACFVRVIVRGG